MYYSEYFFTSYVLYNNLITYENVFIKILICKYVLFKNNLLKMYISIHTLH